MPKFISDIVVDCSELEDDIDHILDGKLKLPTVSAVTLLIDGDKIEDLLIYLDEDYFG